MTKPKILNKFAIKRFLLYCFVGFIYGCSSNGPAPIENRDQPPSKEISSHVVEKGDTLYSIAWLYQKEFKEIAALNGISAPYIISPGDRIRLYGEPVLATQSVISETNQASENTLPSSNRSVVRVVPTAPVVVQTTTTSATPPVASPRAQTSSNQASASQAVTSIPASVPNNAAVPLTVQNWIWPISGNIVKSFGSTGLMNGMVLNATNDQKVQAAADGVVVYAGSAVRGYGNFLVLKHSDLYLSAYAYNEKLLVKEGDTIRQGQQIATAGNDLDGKPRLYFEIRKDGKSVDPIRYLPKR